MHMILDSLGKVYRSTGLWVPQPLGFASRREGYKNCECCVEDCAECIAGTAPAQWEVVLAGIVQGDNCTDDCTDLNDTYILNADHGFQNNCVWLYEFDPHLCPNGPDELYKYLSIVVEIHNPPYVGLGFIATAGQFKGSPGGITTGQWAEDYDEDDDSADPVDCSTLDGRVLPFVSGLSTWCDASNSTATVNAV